MSSSNSQPEKTYGSPCASCKFLRRKCDPYCIFAPHFPADQPQKFEVVHAVYGASNVSKILKTLRYDEREETVKSLVFEAEARLKDPMHGCITFISNLQHRLQSLQTELSIARQELSSYMLSELLSKWSGKYSWSQRRMMEGQSSRQRVDGFGTTNFYGMNTDDDRPHVVLQHPTTTEQLLPATDQPPSQDSTDF